MVSCSHFIRSLVEASFSRSEEHTSELQSQSNLVCRLLLEKKKHRDVKGGLILAPPDLCGPALTQFPVLTLPPLVTGTNLLLLACCDVVYHQACVRVARRAH